MKKHFRKMILGGVLAFLLCACQQAPEQLVVISKNDGSFDINAAVSASETHAPDATQPAQYTEIFYSTDKSVEFRIHVEQTVFSSDMPIVEVTPHTLTEADARRVAQALFGDAEIYEAEPYFAPIYSKQEIQEKLSRWAPYGGGNDEGVVDSFIREYTLMLETAPGENPHSLCRWTFQKATYYVESAEDAAQMDTSQDNDQIQARVRIGGIPYLYSASKRDNSDFKLNSIYAKLDDGSSPMGIDYGIFLSRLCETEKPDYASLDAVKARAEEMLEMMELGQWKIDECYIEQSEVDGKSLYIIHVNAVPEFEGVEAFRRPQLGNLKSEASYASNYYLSNVQFEFGADGGLVYFRMDSPVDVREVVNKNVQTLSLEELFALAKAHFSLSDAHEYDYQKYLENSGEELSCVVDVGKIDYGLTRVKVPETDESYYYVPAVVFSGSIQYVGKESGNVYNVTNDNGSEFQMLILNAVDGSVINSANE